MSRIRLLNDVIKGRSAFGFIRRQFSGFARGLVIGELAQSRPSLLIQTGKFVSRFSSGSRLLSIGEGHFKPDDMSMKEFQEIADETLENILLHCEDLADTKPQVDVELAQGVLTLELPPNGTYVINKQPPNKQIWLSSPVSGPKRYDLVEGKWTYHRDGSRLGDLLRHEVTEALGIEATFDGVDDWSR
ncbi:YFH1 mitochondrial matrix iron chaperone-like protein, partial [Lipomyces arxii]|uniref:YFH1 mitochondrial matrix iron chaperone-like protein n=1 Tax=Lipomyces arxii TaxID=56418 RepID=UPI0034CEA342